MIKFTVALGSFVVLAGCPWNSPSDFFTKGLGEPNGDSPIVVSDGSTHLRHKGAAKDFSIAGGATTVTATVINATATTLNCNKNANCPGAPYNLSNWSLTVYDSGGFAIMTVKPGAAANTIDAIFQSASVDDSKDGSSDTQGSDVSVSTAFASAGLYNNGSTTPIPLTCTSNPTGNSSTYCKLKIDYK